MQLVEQGRLELDRPAADWVPELGETHVLDGFDDSGQPVLRRPRRPITLRHLLTHTAGFAYEIWSPEIIRYQEAKGVPGIITCQNAALQTPLLFDPGDRWEYGINIDWVGKMVEAVSEKRLGAYLQEHVFEPLGMTDTAFELRPDMRARLAKIHQRGEDDALAPLDFEIPQRPRVRDGRRRALWHCWRLPQVRAHGPEPRRGERPPGPAARDGGRDGAQPDGRLPGAAGEDRDAAALERRRVLPRHAQIMGPDLHDQHGGGADRTLRGQPGVGGSPTPTSGSIRTRASAVST